MKAANYKKAVAADVQRLKTHDLDILPANLFYPKVIKMLLGFYCIVVGYPWIVTILIKGNSKPLDFYVDDLLGMSLIFMVLGLFFLPKASEYVTFKETIKPHLTLGKIIEQKFKFFFNVFIAVYVLWSSLHSWLFFANTDVLSNTTQRVFTLIPGCLIGVFIASTLFQMEIARIGIASLFEILSSLKNKDDPMK